MINKLLSYSTNSRLREFRSNPCVLETHPFLVPIFILVFGFLLQSVWINKPQLISLLNQSSEFTFVNNPALKLCFLFLPFVVIWTAELIKFKACYPYHRNMRLSIQNNCVPANGAPFLDIFYFIFSSVASVKPVFVVVATLGLSRILPEMSSPISSLFKVLASAMSIQNPTLELLVGVLVFDFASYLSHRIDHQWCVGWAAHEFHHSAKEMNIFNYFRRSQYESLFSNVIVLPITIVAARFYDESLDKLPFTGLTLLILYTAISSFNNWVGHSSYFFKHNKIISFVFMSPAHHWVHHSINPIHLNKNFGTVFIFWDKLFGTFADVDRDVAGGLIYGVEGCRYGNKNLLLDYFYRPLILTVTELRLWLTKILTRLPS